MISEEDKNRTEEAKKCETCLDWHHHCHAECCKVNFLEIDPKIVEKQVNHVSIKTMFPPSMDMRRYWKLKDVEYVRGLLRFRKERIRVVGGRVLYIHPCKMLDGNLCKGHPDKKPLFCQSLTLETSKLPNQPFRVTENCLFRYKEVDDNVEKKIDRQEGK